MNDQIVIPIRLGPEGLEVDMSAVPEGLRPFINMAAERVAMEAMRERIEHWVTPQVAHEVLSVYGDQEATQPNLARQSLITLIRTSWVSDEELLSELAGVEAFHGYVLAVSVLARDGEDQSGLDVLRAIAGLDDHDDAA